MTYDGGTVSAGSVTVQAYLPRVEGSCPPRSRPTYGTGFKHLGAYLGDRRVESVTGVDLRFVRDDVSRTVGIRIVERARQTGRRLRSYDSDAHGYGAAENFVRSASFFFGCALDDGLITTNPMANVKAPRRPRPPERALLADELNDLMACALAGPDPYLDSGLLMFLRETAARREGALNLTMSAMAVKGRVTLSQKFGVVHEVPISIDLATHLVDLAMSRGARDPADRVFRRPSGQPISRRHFSDFFDRLDKQVEWSEPLDVGAHWLRHTTLTDIANVAGLHVATVYAGHACAKLGAIGSYLDVEFADLAAAHDAVFGGRT